MQKQNTGIGSLDGFIPIYKMADKNKIPRQNLYRWIREHKIAPEDVIRVKVTKEKLFIKENIKLPNTK